jgi:hypothetical protein
MVGHSSQGRSWLENVALVSGGSPDGAFVLFLTADGEGVVFQRDIDALRFGKTGFDRLLFDYIFLP